MSAWTQTNSLATLQHDTVGTLLVPTALRALAERMTMRPLPEGWSTVVSKSQNRPYYVLYNEGLCSMFYVL